MKSKLIVLGLVAFMPFAGVIMASEDHEHGEQRETASDEHKGSMKGSEKGEQVSPDTIEVGNKICPVSKQPVAAMGGAIQYEYRGKIYNFCCKMCVKDFKKNPEKYIKIVEEMMAEEDEGGE